jgi:hypothetical protein
MENVKTYVIDASNMRIAMYIAPKQSKRRHYALQRGYYDFTYHMHLYYVFMRAAHDGSNRAAGPGFFRPSVAVEICRGI